MNYIDKYRKYKEKYLNFKRGGSKKTEIQFILFGDVMTGHQVWYHDNNNKKIDFVDKLKKLGKVIILKPNYVNFMNYSKVEQSMNWFYKSGLKKVNFTIDELQFENYSEWVNKQIDQNKKYIAIGLDQGCHYAKYFCNKYADKCIGLYILIDRNFTKQSYEKTFHSEFNYNFIKSIVGNNYEKYIIENLTNNTIKKILNKIKKLEDNEKYVELLNGICKGIIRSQYDKIPYMKVKTIIYSDSRTLTPEKIDENIKFNEKSNNNITYYYVIDSSEYLIHGKYCDDIYNNIYGLVKSMPIEQTYMKNIKIIKELGKGMHASVYLVEDIITKNKYAMKVEQVYKKDLTEDFKSVIWREIDFAKTMSEKYPQQFMKIYKNENKKCNYVHELSSDKWNSIKKNKEMEKYYKELFASQYCSIKLTSIVDDILHNILYKLDDKRVILDLFIQVVNITYLINREGYYHRDFHPKNIGVKFTNDKYIKILNNKVLTHGYILSALDYGMVLHNKYILEELEGNALKYDNDLNQNFYKIIFKIMLKNLITKYPEKDINKIVPISDDDAKILDKYLININVDDSQWAKQNYDFFQELLYKIIFFNKFQEQLEISDKVELFEFISIESVKFIVENIHNLEKILEHLININKI